MPAIIALFRRVSSKLSRNRPASPACENKKGVTRGSGDQSPPPARRVDINY